MTEINVTGAWLRNWSKKREHVNCDFVANDQIHLTCYGFDCSTCTRNKDAKGVVLHDRYKALGTG